MFISPSLPYNMKAHVKEWIIMMMAHNAEDKVYKMFKVGKW